MYKKVVELRKKNLEKLKENTNNMFFEFIEKTQNQFEAGSLYLTTEIEMNYNSENYTKMSCEEFENFSDTILRTILKLLNDKFCEEELFESYSIKENFKHDYAGNIEKITFIVKATLKS